MFVKSKLLNLESLAMVMFSHIEIKRAPTINLKVHDSLSYAKPESK